MALFFDELDELEAEESAKAAPAPAAEWPEADLGTKEWPDIDSSTRAGGTESADSVSSEGGHTPWNGPAAPATYDVQLHHSPATLSLQQARQAQTLLIREYASKEFQERLRHAHSKAGDDSDLQVAVCEQVGIEAQFRIARQFGFEPSPAGVALMMAVLLQYAQSDAETAHRSAVMQWLLDPVAQLSVPIPKGPARCVVYATAVIKRASGQLVCQFEVHLNDTIRAIKENVFLVTRSQWHSQRLFLRDQELFDQVVLSSVMPVASTVTFRLEFRRQEVVEWLAQLKKGMRVLKEAPTHLMSDPEFILPAVQVQAAVLSLAAPELQADREFLLQIIPHCGQALQFVSPELQADYQLALAAVRHDGWALEFAAPEMRANRDVVVAAIQQDAEALQFAAGDLRTDAEIVLLATRKDPSIVLKVLPELQNDRAVVVRAVQQDWRLLKLVTDEMKADREVVIAAVRQSGFALQHAAPERKADRDIVLMAVQDNGDTLRFAAPAVRADQDVLLAAVKQAGTALGVAPAEAQDLDIALAAVRQDKRSFVYVAPHLRDRVARKLGIDVATEGNPWLESGEHRAGATPDADPLAGLGEPVSLERHLAVLNLPDTASKEEIRRRYHQLALQYHPDKYAGDPEVGKQMFQKVQKAYEALHSAFHL